MSITSVLFVFFAAAVVAVYYLLPKQCRWWALLAASFVFYAMGGLRPCLYILITAASAYFGALRMEGMDRSLRESMAANRETMTKEERSALKKACGKKKRAVLTLVLVLNFGILCVFKYFHFALAQVNGVLGLLHLGEITDSFRFLVPLGISFYTFQTMGYVADVYWGKAPAQQHFGKLLLFVSFFPQITQGPISSYGQLAEQLYAPHDFSYENYSGGCQRMLWGYFKKLAIADVLAPWVADVFANYNAYSSPAVLMGAFFYSVQIYADFSGYMDIMCGLCQILGIRLTENFNRPYFSKSIAEYWRRWHMSLGAWFKNYIYYPIAVSKWNSRLGKWGQKRFGKTFGKTLPASVALVAVWLTTGLWHGASWAYIAWGGVNGLFIIFSLWMEPVYESVRQKLRLSQADWGYRAFVTLRTFVLVTFIKVLPEVGTLRQGLGLWKRCFTAWAIPTSLRQLFPFVTSWASLLMVFFGIFLLFVTSLIQRRTPIRTWFGRFPLPVRAMAMAVLVVLIIYFGVPASGSVGGFLYAQF